MSKLKKPLMVYDKIPPHNLDLEQAIIGTVLSTTDTLDRVWFLKPEMFYKTEHQIIWEAIQELSSDDNPYDILAVSNLLKTKNLLDKVGGYYAIVVLTEKTIHTEIEYHARIVYQNYMRRTIIELNWNSIQKAYDEGLDIFDIVEANQIDLDNIQTFEEKHSASFSTAIVQTKEDVEAIRTGKKTSMLYIKQDQFDKYVQLSMNTIFFIAGDKGVGKTRYLIHTAMNLMANNSNMAALWYTLEDPKDKIIRCIVGNITGLTDQQIQRKNCTMTPEEEARLANGLKELEDNKDVFDIDFVENSQSIEKIKARFRRFVKRRPNKQCMLIIDNFGLIDTSELTGTEVANDDYLAKQILSIKQKTGALIIILHHLNKGQMSKFNKVEGYRPREEFIRGSQRILDYANIACLVNLPKKYKDLYIDEKNKWKKNDNEVPEVEYADATTDKSYFLDHFWSINPRIADKEAAIITSTPEEATYYEFLHQMGERKISFKNMVERYYRYYTALKDMNAKNSDKQYRKTILSIYGWLKIKKHLEPPEMDKEHKDYYLYGENINNEGIIDKLFIADFIKNRDGTNDDDKKIIRYFCFLEYTQFEEWQQIT